MGNMARPPEQLLEASCLVLFLLSLQAVPLLCHTLPILLHTALCSNLAVTNPPSLCHAVIPLHHYFCIPSTVIKKRPILRAAMNVQPAFPFPFSVRSSCLVAEHGNQPNIILENGFNKGSSAQPTSTW